MSGGQFGGGCERSNPPRNPDEIRQKMAPITKTSKPPPIIWFFPHPQQGACPKKSRYWRYFGLFKVIYGRLPGNEKQSTVKKKHNGYRAVKKTRIVGKNRKDQDQDGDHQIKDCAEFWSELRYNE